MSPFEKLVFGALTLLLVAAQVILSTEIDDTNGPDALLTDWSDLGDIGEVSKRGGASLVPVVFRCSPFNNSIRCENGGKGPRVKTTSRGLLCACLCKPEAAGPSCKAPAKSKRFHADWRKY